MANIFAYQQQQQQFSKREREKKEDKTIKNVFCSSILRGGGIESKFRALFIYKVCALNSLHFFFLFKSSLAFFLIPQLSFFNENILRVCSFF